MSHRYPRCSQGILAKSACVTEKCNISPYICESNSCLCRNAHQLCKTMQWKSVLQLFTNYRKNIPYPLKLFIERVQKIYNHIMTKITNQVKIFHQFIQQNLYGSEYYKIMHYISKQDYSKITCNGLGDIISKMTQRINSKSLDQDGNKNMEKFTINEMKNLDLEIKKLLNKVEQLYKNKYRSIECEIREMNKKNNNWSSMGIEIRRPHSASSTISNTTSHKYSNSSTNLGINDTPLAQSLILKRSQGFKSIKDEKFFGGTAQTNLFNLSSPLKSSHLLKNTEMIVAGLGSTKDTKLYNPQSQLSSPVRIKSDLTYPKTINSKIISSASILNHFIIAKVKQYRLIYRASQNHYEIEEFYKKMACHTYAKELNKGNNINESMTLLLVRTQHAKVIGGLTKLKWSRNIVNNEDDSEDEQGNSFKKSNNYKEDIKGTSNMFSIDLNEKYELLDPKYGIYCGNKSIGFGKDDLRIINHSQKHSKNYIGFPNSYNNGNYLPVKKSSMILSGSHDSNYFKVPQWEMFQVVLDKRSIKEEASPTKVQINLFNSQINVDFGKAKIHSQKKIK